MAGGYAADMRLAGTPARYRGMMVGFIVFCALTLLTLLDVRRGFLFAEYPVRTFFYVFNLVHVPMLAIGIAGMFACYRGSHLLEAQLSGTSRYVKAVTLAILALLLSDLFAYRGVPAARSMGSGRIALDWLGAFGVTGWWNLSPKPRAFC